MKSKIFLSALSLILGYSGIASAVECCKANPTSTYSSVRVTEINCVYGQKMSNINFMSGNKERSLQMPPDLCAKVLSQAVAAADCFHNVTADIQTETVFNIESIRSVSNVQIVGTICR